ncbi:MAG TPA: alpha/beta hydrolase [Thermoclostridium caenicola]|nr:alpha/beta hydrolase [Thermoclostridium caenicola]
MGPILLICLGGILIVLVVYIGISRAINQRWLMSPPSEGKFLDSGGKRLFYRSKGKGDPAVIILHNSGRTSMEWWAVQNEIQHARVITFERPGYGWSSKSQATGLASDISDIIDSIIRFERIKKPIILVADGLASIYAHHYACTRPDQIAGAVFVNPVPVDYRHWNASLSDLEDYKKPETVARKRMFLSASGLFRTLSPYRHQFTRFRHGKLIAEFYNSPTAYAASIIEQQMVEKCMDEIRQAGSFPNIPLTILFSSEETLIREWVRNGTSDYTARNAGRIYRILSMDNLYLTPRSRMVELQSGLDLIHMEEPKAIAAHINEMIRELH